MKRLMAFIRWSGLVVCAVMISAWIASHYWYAGVDFRGLYYVESDEGRIDIGAFRHYERVKRDYETSIVVERISDTRFIRKVSEHHKMRRIAWVPFWFLVMASGASSVYLFRRARRRITPGHCRTCGYDLTGNLSGVCPECGDVIQERMEAKVEKPPTPEARKKRMDNREIVKWALIYAVITVPISIILRGVFQCITRP
jgi:hypothetical protein